MDDNSMSQSTQIRQRKQWWNAPIMGLVSLRPVAWVASRMLHHVDRFVMRHTGGKHSAAAFLSGLPIVTLTTTGARSGKRRSVPLIAIPDGDNLIFIASNWGQERHPAWYHNMRANPSVDISYGDWTSEYIAHVAVGTERDRCWNLAIRAYPGYTVYAQRAQNRTIPIMVCKPADTLSEGGKE
jgi:deazaflavin-dependent oxidoreductase (nitroreductase family)